MNPMRLMVERSDDVEAALVETNHEMDGPAVSEPKWVIRGIFAQAEQLNRNKRVYPRKVLENAVAKYNQEWVIGRAALGELNHPPRPDVDPKEASHIITKLEWRGNDLWGEAEILDTPNGEIVKALLKGNVRIGVSTRGMGTVTSRQGTNTVDTNFVLNTIDIVHQPSAPNAYVNGIYESASWVMDDKGRFVESTVQENQEHTDNYETEAPEITDAERVRELKNFLSRF